jgi:hypothetical protein
MKEAPKEERARKLIIRARELSRNARHAESFIEEIVTRTR